MKHHLCFLRPARRRAGRLAVLLAGSLVLAVSTRSAHATAGLEGTFEFAIDAPWRVEPAPDANGNLRYGRLPIVVAILDENIIRHDARFPPPFNSTQPTIRPVVGLGNFGQVRVKAIDLSRPEGSSSRLISQRTYSLNNLFEIEKTTGSWFEDSPAPIHSLCRVWAGDSTSGFGNLSNTSEWHAMLWFDIPPGLEPGSDLHLEAEVDITGDRGLTYAQALADPERGGTKPANLITLKNSLKVHLGEAPLPRFDQGTWAYGDLHYHSQGSDNEGESGYSYRGVLHAMGALGLDFLFATDHASDSRQIVDADLSDSNIGEFIEGATFGEYDPDVTDYHGNELRDMNLTRFRFLWDLLNAGTGAANAEIRNGAGGIPAQVTRTNGFAPQIFLGGELDTVNEAGPQDAARWLDWKPFYDVNSFSVPEQGETFEPDVSFLPPTGNPFEMLEFLSKLDETGTPTALRNGWTIRYGNGLEYSLFNLAGGYLPKKSGAKIRHDNGILDQFGPRALRILSDYWRGRGGFDGYPLFDLQGINDLGFTRAHLVYFPSDPDNRDAFISSRTGEYGGGTRPMVDRRPGQLGLFEEIEQKGFAFLAHSIGPMNPNSEGGNGPDGAPWSDHMYATAFASPSILGLQFWNENVRSETEIKERSTNGREIGHEQPFGEFQGVKRFQRRGFLTGRFELFPFHRDSAWDHQHKNITTIAATLHHGSFTWDKILRWGLDREKTAALEWLPEGEPRKFFMAGGSDAHGDLNYRREGYLTGTSAITDSAVASVRNLVRVPTPPNVVHPTGPGNTVLTATRTDTPTTTTTTTATNTTTFTMFTTPTQATLVDRDAPTSNEIFDDTITPPSTPARTIPQEDVIDSLRAGEFCVTDGPILRIAIDTNDNGVIDSADVPMGGTHSMTSVHPGQDDLTLLVEWKSTPEFGAVRKIDLYVGSHNSDAVSGDGRTYAPAGHGPRENVRIPKSEFDEGTKYRNRSGALFGMLTDNYWRGPSSKLRIELTEGEIAVGKGLSGLKRVELDLNAFPAGGSAGAGDVLADRHYIRAFATTYLPPIIEFTGDDPAECFEDIPGKIISADPDAQFPDICEDLDIDVTNVIVRGRAPARYAFTNPVWIKRSMPTLHSVFDGPLTQTATQDNPDPGFPMLEIAIANPLIPMTITTEAVEEPVLRVEAAGHGDIALHWTSVPDRAYAIEHSTDLHRWAQIASLVATGRTSSFRDTDADRLANARGFYRVRLIPDAATLETHLGVFRFVRRDAAP